MDRVAVLVDAGYLCTGGGQSVAGREVRRHEVNLDIERAYSFVESQAQSACALPLLRVYWYDGAVGGRLSTEQLLLAQHNNVKLRLGVVNGLGQQKEVDTKIVTDLAELARNKAISDAILIGGDGDLRLGIELAQQFGVRVHLMTIEGSSYSQSLRMEADTWVEIQISELRGFLSVVGQVPQEEVPAPSTALGQALVRAAVVSPPAALLLPQSERTPAPQAGAAAATDIGAVLQQVVQEYLQTLSVTQRTNLVAAIDSPTRSIPTDHDRPLLWRAGQALSAQLDNAQKRMLRDEFRRQVDSA